jgi:hypothetical protein
MHEVLITWRKPADQYWCVFVADETYITPDIDAVLTTLGISYYSMASYVEYWTDVPFDWLDDGATGAWAHVGLLFYFEKLDDAIIFKLALP